MNLVKNIYESKNVNDLFGSISNFPADNKTLIKEEPRNLKLDLNDLNLEDEESEAELETPLESKKEEEYPEKEYEVEIQSASSLRKNENSSVKTIDSWDLPDSVVPWDENDKPVEHLLNYAELVLTNEEENGLLTDRIVAACSSYLTESPGNKCHVLAKASLSNKNLNDIRILGYHRFLQYVDLSWNNLKDLTPLGCLPYLMYLDVSHNLLEELLRFKPPSNLTFVNYSYNEVRQIEDLSDFWALCYLDLSHNQISKIQGFHNLRYLRHLDLSHNKIQRFENLGGLKITDLNLEYNLISKFESDLDPNVSSMRNLANLYLNNNLISKLEFLKDMFSLKKLELQSNNISDLTELIHMKHLQNLKHLEMSKNPVSERKPYRYLLLSILQDLKFLDQTEIEISERIAACKKPKFETQLEAAKYSARLILLEMLNDTTLDFDVLPIDEGAYPFVVLVGPYATYKKVIASLLGEKYPDKIYVGKIHTTQKVIRAEEGRFIHTPREEFNEKIKCGKFLCVTENLGQFYAFSREELGKAIKQQKLCLTSMDIVGALTLHSYGLQPFMILTLPQSHKGHLERLKLTYGPVLYSIGCAYMAERQLIDTHDSNIHRVKTILADMLNDLLKTLVFTESPDPSILGHKKGDHETKGISWDPNEDRLTYSDTPSSLDVFYYSTTTACYDCTPSRCGFQTALSLNSQFDYSSLHPNDSKRFSASEAEIKAETTTTSYSEYEPPPMKIEMSSDGGSSYGEINPFSDWSMPFVDWSEVNLSGLKVEEAAELLCRTYIEKVMDTSDFYLNIHLENPGLFFLCLYTDDIQKAIKKLEKVLKEIWRSTPNRPPTFDLNKDKIYQVFIPRKLEKLKEILKSDFLASDKDKTLKGLIEAPPYNSPMTICAEMKWDYGDSIEEL